MQVVTAPPERFLKVRKAWPMLKCCYCQQRMFAGPRLASARCYDNQQLRRAFRQLEITAHVITMWARAARKLTLGLPHRLLPLKLDVMADNSRLTITLTQRLEQTTSVKRQRKPESCATACPAAQALGRRVVLATKPACSTNHTCCCSEKPPARRVSCVRTRAAPQKAARAPYLDCCHRPRGTTLLAPQEHDAGPCRDRQLDLLSAECGCIMCMPPGVAHDKFWQEQAVL